MFPLYYSCHECRISIIVATCFLEYALSNVIVAPVILRRGADPAAEAHDDTRAIVQFPADIPPRRVFADLLQRGRYFQDIFAEHPEPLKIQFGHVCENPHEWEQRFERIDLGRNKHQGKVRWGNRNREYGEHYWDLNHAG